MQYPPVPAVDAIAEHFMRAVRESVRADWPYRHWKLRNVLPLDLCTGILTLPIAPPVLGSTDGTRNSYNDSRCFITPELRRKFPTCEALTQALQRPDVAALMAETCNIQVAGGYLRMEYIQDLDGAWLEPHRDIKEKLFSMVIYLFIGPDAAEWGTDIYDADKRWVGRSSGEFNSGTIFVAGPATWHGFDPRPILGVRRLMEINYVSPDWRDRQQLAMPEAAIRLD
ncbi:MAG TPA: 2OG-Fe(II) oxygenase [Acetobacteraceae bacterium]|nr:2OG-Fe(II) oxygenase [Acetobacteraceae bacterium]